MPWGGDALNIGSRRELFIDNHLVDKLDGAVLTLNRPKDEGVVMKFDKPWEGRFSMYVTILKDGENFRMYYRGESKIGRDGNDNEVTCTAHSTDGINWTKPELSLYKIAGSRNNNVVLANATPASHNFCPFIDTRPGVSAEQRFKALAGYLQKRTVGLRFRRRLALA